MDEKKYLNLKLLTLRGKKMLKQNQILLEENNIE